MMKAPEEEEEAEGMLEEHHNVNAMDGANANIDVEALERLAKFKAVKEAFKQLQDENGNGTNSSRALLEVSWMVYWLD